MKGQMQAAMPKIGAMMRSHAQGTPQPQQGGVLNHVRSMIQQRRQQPDPRAVALMNAMRQRQQ